MCHARAALALLLSVSAGCAARPAPSSPLPVADAPRPTPGSRLLVIPLGTSGGIDEADLTSFLVGPARGESFVALDAGSLHAGIGDALRAGAFGVPGPARGDASLAPEAAALALVKAALISHPHLDHVAGLVLHATDDSTRVLLGTAATLDALRDHLFNWRIWPNFLDEGTPPRLGRYHPTRLALGVETTIDGTPFAVTALPLAHGGAESTAFLLHDGGDAWALYLGDTGPDAVEKSDHLARVWERAAPLVRARTLRVLFIECSYADPRRDDQLFGHLTPRWLRAELDALGRAVLGRPPAPGEAPLDGLAVVVTHVKPSLSSDRGDARARIAAALGPAHLGARFVHPRRGQPLWF